MEKGKTARVGLFKRIVCDIFAGGREKGRTRTGEGNPISVYLCAAAARGTEKEDLTQWERFVNGSLKHF